jgi:hypothetical protein
MNKILDEIRAERKKQEEKWGEQNHPCLDLDVLASHKCTPEVMTEAYNIPSELQAKDITDRNAENGTLTYADIALEEFCEVVSEFDPVKRRQELVQLAAVTVAWIEKIDRDLKKQG